MGRMNGTAPASASGLTAERVVFFLLLALLLVGVVGRPVRWDWLFDSAALLAAGYLAFASQPAHAEAGMGYGSPRLLLALYLLLDAAGQLLVTLCFPSWRVLAFGALTGCLVLAVRGELRMRGIMLQRLSPGRLLQPPALALTLCLIIALGCLYLPMLVQFQGFSAWSGPTLIRLPGTMYMNAGHTVTFGGNVLVRGVQASWSRVALLLLAGALCVHLLRVNGLSRAPWTGRFLRLAAVLVALWWLLPAHGLRSLRQPADLLFAVASAVLLFQVFARQPVNTAVTNL